jgi:glycosyltransferase involved in cell wall biosynthesis
MKTISIVTPCFNEELNVSRCHEAVRSLFENELKNFAREHIFCDNASRDSTPEMLRQIAKEDKCVKIILNARNFGPLRSTFNGVLATSGDAVLLFLPADLQDPPALIPKFVSFWQEGYEVVYGIREHRDERWLMRSVRKLYYHVLTALSDLSVPPNVGDFQLVDRVVVEAMRKIEDAYPFMRMMTFECGFKSIGVPYHWEARSRGVSKNSLARLIDQGMNGLVTFTTFPVRFVLFAGFAIAALSILYAFVTLLISLIYYRELAAAGIPTIIVALFFFGGVQLFVTGLVGEYVLAIYSQVRRKPLVFERERINFDPNSPGVSETI